MTRGRLPIALAAVAASLALSAEATAAPQCGERVRCMRVTVPLDRGGAVPGSVRLLVQRRPALRRTGRAPVVVLAGGPGQSATEAYAGAIELIELGFTRDVVVFDQRGTGWSGLLRCRDLEAASGLAAERQVAACGTLLGDRRSHYTTSDSVEDIEAVRRRIGADKIALLGVSYGTYAAMAYASRYPSRVDRLVLDSVVDPGGVDAFYRDSIAAARRNMRALCRECRFTDDPVADMSRLVARLSDRPLGGYVVTRQGRRHRASMDGPGLLYTLIGGDVDPFSRAEMPAAVTSALRGDHAPLLRLQRRAVQLEAVGSPRAFSSAVLAATLCEEAPLPWPRTAPPGERAGHAWTAAELIPRDVLYPFNTTSVAGSDVNRFCRGWPAAATAPPPIGELPDVPTLLLAGAQDMRTPVETARRVAARLPRGRLLEVPGVGHSVLGQRPCADRALLRFFAGRRVPARCPGERDLLRATEPSPLSLRELRPLRGSRGLRGRALAGVEATVVDLLFELLATLQAVDERELERTGKVVAAGLRGGRAVVSIDDGFRLRGYEYIPGVRVSGVLSDRARLRVHGPRTPDGRLTLRGRRVVGRIGGRRVEGRAGRLLLLFGEEPPGAAAASRPRLRLAPVE